ncbi:MAG TPA: sugar ABC transporter permease [Chloroflexota bacterium]|nr:sugar ABC transporter permease [Chloroflexota bacterium]
MSHAAPVARKRRFVTRLDLLGWLFVSPWVIGFLVFTFFPFLASLFLSFTDWGVVGAWHWLGTANYQNMVNGNDDRFPVALGNTLYYASINVPGTQVIALALALLLNRKTRGIALYRTLFYIPAIASGVGTSYLWAIVFSNHGGLLNTALAFIGIQGPNWLYSLTWSMPALIIIGLWNVGTSMLIYLAALQGVPQSLYDAAAIDGANRWGQFRHVTIPMITPAMFFNLVLGVIGSFQVFTAAYIITGGGPGDATLFYTLYLYQVAFQNLRMGYAAALAWVLFLIIMAITVIQLVVARLWVYYEGSTAGGLGGPR